MEMFSILKIPGVRMDYETIKKSHGYCGLSCGKCLFFREGEIRQHAEKLQELLGNFDRFAERFSSFDETFTHYPQFKKFLAHLAAAGCGGCRSGACRYPDCGVQPCASERGLDFCFQCEAFPCEKSNFDDDLKERWIAMNRAMKEEGVAEYVQRTRDIPRYR